MSAIYSSQSQKTDKRFKLSVTNEADNPIYPSIFLDDQISMIIATDVAWESLFCTASFVLLNKFGNKVSRILSTDGI